MLILGINSFHGDSSAAIIKDGELIYAVEEERLRRVKHWAGVPTRAIQQCLISAGADLEDIDYIVLSKNPFAHIGEKIYLSIKNTPSNTLNRVRANLSLLSLKDYLKKDIPTRKRIKARIVFVEHHKAHIACAYFSSPFKDGLILSCDGAGDMITTMWGIAKAGKINITGSIKVPHSLGFLYTAFTQFLGFSEYGDEYKVMGLAPFGKPHYTKEIDKIVRIKRNGSFTMDLSYFNIKY